MKKKYYIQLPRESQDEAMSKHLLDGGYDTYKAAATDAKLFLVDNDSVRIFTATFRNVKILNKKSLT